MVIKVIKAFRDVNNPKKVIKAGEIIEDFDDGRARSLVLRGLAVIELISSPPPPLQKERGEGKGVIKSDALEPPAGELEDEKDVSGNDAKGDVPVEEIDLGGNHFTIIAKVKVFADVEKLKVALDVEEASVKPRQSVVEALKARISELDGK